MRPLVVAALALAAMSIAMWLYPYDSDGPFSMYDGLSYGMAIESAPAKSIIPHHPLFHILGIVIAWTLDLVGVKAAGHMAVRIVAGAGALVLMWWIVRLAGRRWWIGAAFAVLLLSCRSVVIEAATGENVLPACAAAVIFLDLATRSSPDLLKTGAALVVALLLRQDNLLLVPGAAIGLWLAPAMRERRARVAWMLLVSGAVTISLYAITWALSGDEHESFVQWLTLFAQNGSWTGPKEPELARFTVHLDALSAAIAGRHWPGESEVLWLGPAFLVAILAAGRLLRGTGPVRTMALVVGIGLAIRACFFTWFEADNVEWHVLPLSFVVALAARMASGEPTTPRWARVTGGALICLMAAASAAAHVPYTVELREHRLMSSVREAVSVAGKGCRFVAHGHHIGMAFTVLGVPHTIIPDEPSAPDKALDALSKELQDHPVRTMVVINRFVRDGMPYNMKHWRDARWFIDEWQDDANATLVRREGLVFAVLFSPGPVSKPASTSKPGPVPRRPK